jgi:hypothetical protein
MDTMTFKRCVSPEAPVPAPAAIKLESRAAISGIRLGILDNSKGNADHLLGFLIDTVRGQLPVTAVVKRRKPAASRPADPAVIDELARETDFVISAMAD